MSKKKIIYAGLLAVLVAASVNNYLNEASEQSAAEEGGFESANEYRLAKIKGFNTKPEYDLYLREKSVAEKQVASDAGFLSVEEYKEALAVSMPTKALYDKYLVQKTELKLAEEKRKAEAKLAEEKKLNSIAVSSDSNSTEATAGNVEVAMPEHMKVENVRQTIKDYLGPCSGSACQINIDLLKKYLSKHEDYAEGKISALVLGTSGSSYIEAYLRNGEQIEVYYYGGDLKKKKDIVKIDKSEISEIYSSALKTYGAEVFEDWYRAPTSGIRNLKSNIESLVRTKANAHMANKEASAAEEWNKN